ncbi:hypothetical protein BR93DRAFT_924438 [Coniochaeta sp. PMI_546]|nr:hypothetical protein BR93DRAFT_924438 [Coniochaeta sp. PMI_546]
MPVKRVDDFCGDGLAYASYLCEQLFRTLPLSEVTHLLEEQLKKIQPAIQCLTPPPNAGHDFVEISWPTQQDLPANGKPAISSHTEQELSGNGKPRNLGPRTTCFFKNLPISEEQWVQKRKSVGLSSSDDILRAVDYLTTGKLTYDNSTTDYTTSPDVQDVLNAFAHNSGKSLVKGQFTQMLSHFNSLVFIATCQVALDQGHPKSGVDDAQRQFLEESSGKCEAAPKQLAKHRSAVRWLLQEQQRQFRRGLGHRGLEIFINEGRDINFYTKCPKRSGSRDLFTNQIPLCKVPDEIQASLPFWLPFFVKFITGDRWSYTEICKALDIDLLSQEEDYQSWKRVYLSRTLVACPIITPAPIHQPSKRRKRVPRKLPASSKGAAVKSHSKGSNNSRTQVPYKETDLGPRDVVFSRQPSTLSLISSPLLSGSTCSTEESSATQPRPIGGSKRLFSEAEHHDQRAKRRKTQRNDKERDGRRTYLSDDGTLPRPPLEGFSEGALPMVPGVDLLPNAQPTHAGTASADEPEECNQDQHLSILSRAQLRGTHINTSDERSISPLDLLLAAAEQDGGATTATGCFCDGPTGSVDDAFGLRGNPEIMLGTLERPGAGQSKPDQAESRFKDTTYDMMDMAKSRFKDTTYDMMDAACDLDDDTLLKEFVEFG